MYFNSYIDKEYEIQVDFKENNEFTLYIDGVNASNIREKGGFLIDPKTYNGFIENLKIARDKYEEWSKVAIENGVKEFSKEVELKHQNVGGYFYGSKWFFDFNVRPSFTFKVIQSTSKGTQNIMLVDTNKLTSSSNQYIDSEGFILIFSTLVEFDEFLKLVSVEKIQEFKNKSANKDSLFKN